MPSNDPEQDQDKPSALLVFEDRDSDSPFVEMIWHGGAYSEYRPICPADVRWDLLLLRHGDKVTISVEGPLTRAKPKVHPEGTEWRVIKFKLGAFMPYLPVTHLLDSDVILPEGSRKTFWLNGSTWEFPSVDDVEAFVARHGIRQTSGWTGSTWRRRSKTWASLTAAPSSAKQR